MNEKDAKQAVADAGRELLRERLVARTWGNVSCRVGEQSFVITPSGLAYESMTAQDIVEYDMMTGQWKGTRKPSSEKGIHAAAYKLFPNAGFVIHTHQTYASALGLAGFDASLFSEGERALLGGIALSGYGLPGTKRLRANVTKALSSGAHTVLMAQHGALIVGWDRQEVFERAIRLEKACKSICRGQPEEPKNTSDELAVLIKRIGNAFPHIAYTVAPAVRETALTAKAFHAQLDDMAQMIGPKLIAVKADPGAVEKALQSHEAVLVSGAGAICRAGTAEDCEALCLLVEKACVGYLHTRALDAHADLSHMDTLLMRVVYKHKYSKKMRA